MQVYFKNDNGIVDIGVDDEPVLGDFSNEEGGATAKEQYEAALAKWETTFLGWYTKRGYVRVPESEYQTAVAAYAKKAIDDAKLLSEQMAEKAKAKEAAIAKYPELAGLI